MTDMYNRKKERENTYTREQDDERRYILMLFSYVILQLFYMFYVLFSVTSLMCEIDVIVIVKIPERHEAQRLAVSSFQPLHPPSVPFPPHQ